MKLTNEAILEARDPLMELMKEKLPVKCSFKVARLANRLNAHLKDFQDSRTVLFNKYGTKNEKGQMQVKEGDPNHEKFVADLKELMAIEVEVIVEKIKLPEDLVIEPKTLMALEKLIEV